MTTPFTLSLTPDAAADLACDFISDFVRCHGGAIRPFDLFSLGVAQGRVLQTQALILSGWMSGKDADVLLDNEVAAAMSVLDDMVAEYS